MLHPSGVVPSLISKCSSGFSLLQHVVYAERRHSVSLHDLVSGYKVHSIIFDIDQLPVVVSHC